VIGANQGGTADFPARLLSSLAMDYLGQPMILQFKPGAGGIIGNIFVINSKPDGYTLCWGITISHSTIPAIEGKPGGPDDFTAVCRITYQPGSILTHPNAPFKTFKEMLAWAKANPGKLTFGHTGAWGSSDLLWRQIKKETGIVTRDIPHDGSAPLMTALLGGHIMVAGFSAAAAMPYVEGGKLIVLAVADNQRYPAFPNVPTAKEEGVDVNNYMWLGILTPKAMPRGITDQLDAAIKKMVENKFFVETLQKLGQEVGYMGPDEFDRFWRNEYEYYKELGKTFKK
jgi:tripartite-type tricarboxylate transporter receptor subunit TctC